MPWAARAADFSTKVHQLVDGIDGQGLSLVVLLSPGKVGDSPMLLPLLQQLTVGCSVGRPRIRPDGLCGDKAYSSRAIRKHLRGRRITTHILESVDQKGH